MHSVCISNKLGNAYSFLLKLRSPHPPQAESSPVSISGKPISSVHCTPGLMLAAALRDFAKELKPGIPNHSLDNLI